MEPASRPTFSLAGAGGILLGYTSACIAVGAIIGWVAGSIGYGVLVGALAGIPVAIVAVYRTYKGYFV